MRNKLTYLLSFVVLFAVITGIAEGASLWGYYPINENDLNDYSGNDHHGIAVDGPVTVFDSERGWVVSFKEQPSLPSRVNCGTDDPSAGDQLSVSVWIKWDGLNGNWQGMAGKSFQYGQRRWIFQLRADDGMIQWGGSDADGLDIWSNIPPAIGQWQHVAGTSDGSFAKVYINGEIVGEGESGFTPDSAVDANVTLGFGEDRDDYDESFNGLMDEIYIYSRTLSDNQILDLFNGIPVSFNRADNPEPANGSLHFDVWANLSWSPGDAAASHDVYFGDNFDDVNDGTGDTFQGNQSVTFIVVGFPGFAFPDGLVPGMTYYWRIDEIEADGTTKHKGTVWNFTVPPKTAYDPVPADTAESVAPDVELTWAGGFGAKLHTVYFGDNFDDVNNATLGQSLGVAKYSPGQLKMAKTYYWRVDEFDAVDTFKGNVWSFTTEGKVSNPEPANGAVDIIQAPILSWSPGIFSDTHEVYLGTEPASLELKGSGNLSSESFQPGELEWNTTYYWRIDEANNANADSPWTGPLWSFTTANFLIIDDMESYNDIEEGEPGSNRIYVAWADGFDDPTNGSQVGNLDAPFAEPSIVHGGNWSMPFAYDNAVGKSEATSTLTSNRDWTVNGVNTLTIWFRGEAGNAAEQMYVALNGNARIDHDNLDAALRTSWTEWNIDLQAFADQGVNLSNVISITLGLSSVTGGTGKMYFDDIRLYAQ